MVVCGRNDSENSFLSQNAPTTLSKGQNIISVEGPVDLERRFASK
jgi:hypothetical protein